MSDVTAEYVDKFWELIDVLNATICFNRPRATSNTYQNTFYSCYHTDNKANHKIYFDLHTLNSSAKKKSLRKRYLF
jgi:hypothetical protein